MKLRALLILVPAIIVTISGQVPDPRAAVQAGAVLFQDNCVRCHGADLKGTKKAPALVEIRKKKNWTDEKIAKRVLNGEDKMPPFRDTLSEEQAHQLAAFLRAENRPTLSPAQDRK